MSPLRTLYKTLAWPVAAPLKAVRRHRRVRARALRAAADRLTLDARAACVVGDQDRAVALTRNALSAYDAAPPGALRALGHLKLLTASLPRSLASIEAQLDGLRPLAAPTRDGAVRRLVLLVDGEVESRLAQTHVAAAFPASDTVIVGFLNCPRPTIQRFLAELPGGDGRRYVFKDLPVEYGMLAPDEVDEATTIPRTPGGRANALSTLRRMLAANPADAFLIAAAIDDVSRIAPVADRFFGRDDIHVVLCPRNIKRLERMAADLAELSQSDRLDWPTLKRVGRLARPLVLPIRSWTRRRAEARALKAQADAKAKAEVEAEIQALGAIAEAEARQRRIATAAEERLRLAQADALALRARAACIEGKLAETAALTRQALELFGATAPDDRRSLERLRRLTLCVPHSATAIRAQASGRLPLAPLTEDHGVRRLLLLVDGEVGSGVLHGHVAAAFPACDAMTVIFHNCAPPAIARVQEELDAQDGPPIDYAELRDRHARRHGLDLAQSLDNLPAAHTADAMLIATAIDDLPELIAAAEKVFDRKAIHVALCPHNLKRLDLLAMNLDDAVSDRGATWRRAMARKSRALFAPAPASYGATPRAAARAHRLAAAAEARASAAAAEVETHRQALEAAAATRERLALANELSLAARQACIEGEQAEAIALTRQALDAYAAASADAPHTLRRLRLATFCLPHALTAVQAQASGATPLAPPTADDGVRRLLLLVDGDVGQDILAGHVAAAFPACEVVTVAFLNCPQDAVTRIRAELGGVEAPRFVFEQIRDDYARRHGFDLRDALVRLNEANPSDAVLVAASIDDLAEVVPAADQCFDRADIHVALSPRNLKRLELLANDLALIAQAPPRWARRSFGRAFSATIRTLGAEPPARRRGGVGREGRALQIKADALTLDARAAALEGDRGQTVALTRTALAAYEAAPPGATRALNHLKLLTLCLPHTIAGAQAQLSGRRPLATPSNVAAVRRPLVLVDGDVEAGIVRTHVAAAFPACESATVVFLNNGREAIERFQAAESEDNAPRFVFEDIRTHAPETRPGRPRSADPLQALDGFMAARPADALLIVTSIDDLSTVVPVADRHFGRHDIHVALCARNLKRLERLATDLAALPPRGRVGGLVQRQAERCLRLFLAHAQAWRRRRAAARAPQINTTRTAPGRARLSVVDGLALDARAAMVSGDLGLTVELTRQSVDAYDAAPSTASRALAHLQQLVFCLPHTLTAARMQLSGMHSLAPTSENADVRRLLLLVDGDADCRVISGHITSAFPACELAVVGFLNCPKPVVERFHAELRQLESPRFLFTDILVDYTGNYTPAINASAGAAYVLGDRVADCIVANQTAPLGDLVAALREPLSQSFDDIYYRHLRVMQSLQLMMTANPADALLVATSVDGLSKIVPVADRFFDRDEIHVALCPRNLRQLVNLVVDLANIADSTPDRSDRPPPSRIMNFGAPTPFCSYYAGPIRPPLTPLGPPDVLADGPAERWRATAAGIEAARARMDAIPLKQAVAALDDLPVTRYGRRDGASAPCLLMAVNFEDRFHGALYEELIALRKDGTKLILIDFSPAESEKARLAAERLFGDALHVDVYRYRDVSRHTRLPSGMAPRPAGGDLTDIHLSAWADAGIDVQRTHFVRILDKVAADLTKGQLLAYIKIAYAVLNMIRAYGVSMAIACPTRNILFRLINQTARIMGVPTLEAQAVLNGRMVRHRAPNADYCSVLETWSRDYYAELFDYPRDRLLLGGTLRYDAIVEKVRDAATHMEVAGLRQRIFPDGGAGPLVMFGTQPMQLSDNLDSIRRLLDALAAIPDAHLVIKLHPAEGATNFHAYEELARDRYPADRCRVTRDVDTYALIMAADLTVSQTSNILLEAGFLDRRALALHFGGYPPPVEFEEMGAAIILKDPARLPETVRDLLAAAPGAHWFDARRARFIAENPQLTDMGFRERLAGYMDEVERLRPDAADLRRADEARLAAAKPERRARHG